MWTFQDFGEIYTRLSFGVAPAPADKSCIPRLLAQTVQKSNERGTNIPKPDPIMTDVGQEEYEVEEIINHRKRRRGRTTKIEYLILWKGYPGIEMTCEPEENIANVQEKIAEYYGRVEGNAFPKEGRL